MFSLLGFFIGAFVPVIILFLLIIIHEVGHASAALICGVSVDKIYIYPFGGLSKINLSMNESLYKELFILVMGPVFQVICYFTLINISYFSEYSELINIYNITILVFNLLPIYPLDGGRLLNIFLSFSIPLKKSLKITFILSYVTLFIFSCYLLFHYFSINVVVIISFLCYKLKKENDNRNMIFDKFLLERYLYNYHFSKRKKVNTVDDFMRNKKHLVKVNNKYYTESEILCKKFGNKY